MRIRVNPSPLAGSVDVPGDKSVSHRALILGALVGEPVEVRGLAASGDVASTAGALRRLGAVLDLERSADRFDGVVSGPLREADDVLDCGNSGTALRLLAGVVAGIDGMAVLTGDASLRSRPVDRVAVPLERMGAQVSARDGGRLPPLVIRGGRLEGIRYEQPVASAQVKSCLLLAGLRASGPTTVVSPLPSRDHTERLLRHLGAEVTTSVTADGRDGVRVAPGELRPAPIDVPRDPSSAAFWHVAAAVGRDGGAITTPGICLNPTRSGALTLLEALGAAVSFEREGELGSEPVADVTVTPSQLEGGEIAGRAVVDAIDELPILALAGACSGGGLVVDDASELRLKESDRITALATTFRALGLDFEERARGFAVRGGQRPRTGSVQAGGDHRIAMTAAIAGTVATGPVEVDGFEAVTSSYPSFLDHLTLLGGSVEVLQP